MCNIFCRFSNNLERLIDIIENKIRILQLSLDNEYVPTDIKADVHKKQDLLKEIVGALKY